MSGAYNPVQSPSGDSISAPQDKQQQPESKLDRMSHRGDEDDEGDVPDPTSSEVVCWEGQQEHQQQVTAELDTPEYTAADEAPSDAIPLRRSKRSKTGRRNVFAPGDVGGAYDDATGGGTTAISVSAYGGGGASNQMFDDRLSHCFVDGVDYFTGNFVYYEEAEFEYFTIGLIEEIKVSRRDRFSISVKCFYRTQDIPESCKQALMDREQFFRLPVSGQIKDRILARELFMSEIQETLSARQLRGLCKVLHLADLRSALTGFSPDEEDTFFYTFAYNPESRRLIPTRTAIRVGKAYQAVIPAFRHQPTASCCNLRSSRAYCRKRSLNGRHQHHHRQKRACLVYPAFGGGKRAYLRSLSAESRELLAADDECPRKKKRPTAVNNGTSSLRHQRPALLYRRRRLRRRGRDTVRWLPNGLASALSGSLLPFPSMDEQQQRMLCHESLADEPLKTYLDAVRSIVAFFSFGGADDDDVVSAENGLVLANLAITSQHAYDTLHRSAYSLRRALQHISCQPIPHKNTPRHWTADQVRLFLQALHLHGKDFFTIQREFFNGGAGAVGKRSMTTGGGQPLASATTRTSRGGGGVGRGRRKADALGSVGRQTVAGDLVSWELSAAAADEDAAGDDESAATATADEQQLAETGEEVKVGEVGGFTSCSSSSVVAIDPSGLGNLKPVKTVKELIAFYYYWKRKSSCFTGLPPVVVGTGQTNSSSGIATTSCGLTTGSTTCSAGVSSSCLNRGSSSTSVLALACSELASSEGHQVSSSLSAANNNNGMVGKKRRQNAVRGVGPASNGTTTESSRRVMANNNNTTSGSSPSAVSDDVGKENTGGEVGLDEAIANEKSAGGGVTRTDYPETNCSGGKEDNDTSILVEENDKECSSPMLTTTTAATLRSHRRRHCRNCESDLQHSVDMASPPPLGQLRFLCHTCRIHLQKYGELKSSAPPRSKTDATTAATAQLTTISLQLRLPGGNWPASRDEGEEEQECPGSERSPSRASSSNSCSCASHFGDLDLEDETCDDDDDGSESSAIGSSSSSGQRQRQTEAGDSVSSSCSSSSSAVPELLRNDRASLPPSPGQPEEEGEHQQQLTSISDLTGALSPCPPAKRENRAGATVTAGRPFAVNDNKPQDYGYHPYLTGFHGTPDVAGAGHSRGQANEWSDADHDEEVGDDADDRDYQLYALLRATSTQNPVPCLIESHRSAWCRLMRCFDRSTSFQLPGSQLAFDAGTCSRTDLVYAGRPLALAADGLLQMRVAQCHQFADSLVGPGVEKVQMHAMVPPAATATVVAASRQVGGSIEERASETAGCKQLSLQTEVTARQSLPDTATANSVVLNLSARRSPVTVGATAAPLASPHQQQQSEQSPKQQQYQHTFDPHRSVMLNAAAAAVAAATASNGLPVSAAQFAPSVFGSGGARPGGTRGGGQSPGLPGPESRRQAAATGTFYPPPGQSGVVSGARLLSAGGGSGGGRALDYGGGGPGAPPLGKQLYEGGGGEPRAASNPPALVGDARVFETLRRLITERAPHQPPGEIQSYEQEILAAATLFVDSFMRRGLRFDSTQLAAAMTCSPVNSISTRSTPAAAVHSSPFSTAAWSPTTSANNMFPGSRAVPATAASPSASYPSRCQLPSRALETQSWSGLQQKQIQEHLNNAALLMANAHPDPLRPFGMPPGAAAVAVAALSESLSASKANSRLGDLVASTPSSALPGPYASPGRQLQPPTLVPMELPGEQHQRTGRQVATPQPSPPVGGHRATPGRSCGGGGAQQQQQQQQPGLPLPSQLAYFAHLVGGFSHGGAAAAPAGVPLQEMTAAVMGEPRVPTSSANSSGVLFGGPCDPGDLFLRYHHHQQQQQQRLQEQILLSVASAQQQQQHHHQHQQSRHLQRNPAIQQQQQSTMNAMAAAATAALSFAGFPHNCSSHGLHRPHPPPQQPQPPSL